MTRRLLSALRPPLAPRTADPEADRVFRDHARLLDELRLMLAVGMRILTDVELADATNVPVAHGLGRPPRWVAPSCARPGTGLTGGQVVEVRDGSIDRNTHILLRAVGFGATVTVDVLVL